MCVYVRACACVCVCVRVFVWADPWWMNRRTITMIKRVPTQWRCARQKSPIKEPYYTQKRPTDIGIPQVCTPKEPHKIALFHEP